MHNQLIWNWQHFDTQAVCNFYRQEAWKLNSANMLYQANKLYLQNATESQVNATLEQLRRQMTQYFWQMPVCAPFYRYSLDETLLPHEFIQVVEHVAKLSGYPMGSAMLALLVAVSIACRGRYMLRLHDQWFEPPVLYGLIAANSGMRKDFFEEQYKKPFWDFEDARNCICAEKQNIVAEQQKMLRKAKESARVDFIRTALKDARRKDIGLDLDKFFASTSANAEDIAEAEKRHVVEKEYPVHLFADGFTEKKLLLSMYRQGGGMALFRTEGQSLLNVLNGRNVNLDIFLNAYNMKPESYQSMTAGETYIRHPFINLLYIVQPDVLVQLYKNERFAKRGLTPRFLPYFVQQIVDPQMLCDGSPLKAYRNTILRMLEVNYTQNANRKLRFINTSHCCPAKQLVLTC
jgi:hypothetical protein